MVIVSRYPVQLARDGVPRDPFPVMVCGIVDTIKAGLMFPALIRRLYFFAVWKAKQAYIFRTDRLSDLFQV